MRLNYFISEYKKNWVICTIGIVLHVLGVLILSINEGGTGRKNFKKPILMKFYFFRANLQSHASFA